MQTLRLLSVAMGALLIWSCSTTTSKPQSPKHIRQSTRQLNLAAKHYIKGCYVRALEHYQQAHERFTAADQLDGIGHSLNGLANVYYRMGELTSAVLAYNDAIEIYDAVGATDASVRAMCSKAAALLSAGRLDEAEASLRQAEDKARGKEMLAALRLKTRAIMQMQRGDAEGAEMLLQKAISIANVQEHDQRSSINFTMGRLLLNGQQPSKAIAFLERSLVLDRAAGAYDDIAHDLETIGRCYVQLSQFKQAAIHLKRSIKIFALLGNADKAQKLAVLMGSMDERPENTYKTTIHWASQWINGQKEANLCR